MVATTPAIMVAITAAATAAGESEKSPAALCRRAACLHTRSEWAAKRPSYARKTASYRVLLAAETKSAISSAMCGASGTGLE
jgi:hypothetical protein